ncbi:MAG: serine protease [Myxococcota bacterium]|nr:serine protease [Myxococcota bacterium]
MNFWILGCWAMASEPEPVEKWMESVVLILTGPSYCSGVVIDPKGTVATAYHCISSGLAPMVRFEDGSNHIARIVAADRENDLALLQLPAGTYPALRVRTTRAVRGEEVYALGHPFAPAAENAAFQGTLLWSISQGIVSNVGRAIIQTDTALNPGNSGGALVDTDGAVLGIVSRKIRGENVSFAVSSKALRELEKDPKPLSLFSGLWHMYPSLDVPLTIPGTSALSFRWNGIIRERFLLEFQASYAWRALEQARTSGEAISFPYGAGVGVRQRIGRGTASVFGDVGAGVWMGEVFRMEDDLFSSDQDFHYGFWSRLGWGGYALRTSVVMLDEPLFLFSVEMYGFGLNGIF